ncbi:hypothetical protein ACFY3O_27850 [Streptomyces sp. NPDC001046]|uniref:hypothetical protein n=1 Tax=Streptomyces sp. NPDC001046 TaxID=3364543 RepID=UPI00367CD832
MRRRTDRHRNLPALLTELHTQRHTGTVVVAGSPGSRIHLRAGRVSAVETPGSPGVETLLRGSARVTDETWAAMCAAAETADGDLAADLEAAGLLSRHAFDVVCTAALFDGAFTTALTVPDGWELTEATPVPWAGPSFTPRRLAAETTRRLDTLAARWGAPPAEVARTPFLAASKPPARIPPRYAALLQAVNGRRTPRDIAFALGRGTYAVLLDLARMHELELVLRAQPGPDTGRPSTAARRPERPATGLGRVVPLPRRNPGRHRAQQTDDG